MHKVAAKLTETHWRSKPTLATLFMQLERDRIDLKAAWADEQGHEWVQDGERDRHRTVPWRPRRLAALGPRQRSWLERRSVRVLGARREVVDQLDVSEVLQFIKIISYAQKFKNSKHPLCSMTTTVWPTILHTIWPTMTKLQTSKWKSSSEPSSEPAREARRHPARRFESRARPRVLRG